MIISQTHLFMIQSTAVSQPDRGLQEKGQRHIGAIQALCLGRGAEGPPERPPACVAGGQVCAGGMKRRPSPLMVNLRCRAQKAVVT